jgi:hypothetical protein
MSIYDPLLPEPSAHHAGDLERVRAEFGQASRPFLGSVATWLAWAIVLPAAALITRRLPADAYAAVLFTWSGAILLAGAVEAVAIFRRAQRQAPTPLGVWALRSQGNLSSVGIALSIALVWQDLAWVLPGLWLLLLGHSFYVLGGLAFAPLRRTGILYQLGGAVALLPADLSLEVFAVTAGVANLWMAWSVLRR